MRDAISQLDSRKEGWFKEPLPTPFDATVARMVDDYIEASESDRATMVDAIDKELLILLPLFWRSAERVGVDGSLLFKSAADLVGDDAPSWIRSFPERDEQGRSLGVMGFEEHEEPNGLLYRRKR